MKYSPLMLFIFLCLMLNIVSVYAAPLTTSEINAINAERRTTLKDAGNFFEDIFDGDGDVNRYYEDLTAEQIAQINNKRSFMDTARGYVNTYLTPYWPTSDGNPYYPANAATVNNKINQYENKFNETLPEKFPTLPSTGVLTTANNNASTNFSNIDNSAIQNKEDLKARYARYASSVMEGYFQDGVSGNFFSAADYANDFNMITESIDQRINPPVINAVKRHLFDPRDELDRGVPGLSRDKIQTRLDYAGANNIHYSASMRNLAEYVTSQFSYDTQLQEDFSWQDYNWGNELNVTMTESNPNVNNKFSDLTGINYNTHEGYVGKAYNVNEYGAIVDESMGAVGYTYTMIDGIYNNRQYGFRDGYYNTASIQVGDRKYQLVDKFFTSPIVLDLDGDGKLEASKGEWLPHNYQATKLAEFDIDGDEFLDLTEWVGPNDGLLMVYNKEKEVNGNAFFGFAGGFTHGFEKLSLLDTNNDKVISGDELKTLSVWQDKNGNAKIDDGEVTAVVALGITSISVNHDSLVSSFVQNGATKKSWDWHPCVFGLKRVK